MLNLKIFIELILIRHICVWKQLQLLCLRRGVGLYCQGWDAGTGRPVFQSVPMYTIVN